MKKQNANNKLAFNKATVIELNNNELSEVNGGTTVPCGAVAAAAVASSILCGAIASAFVIGVAVGIAQETRSN